MIVISENKGFVKIKEENGTTRNIRKDIFDKLQLKTEVKEAGTEVEEVKKQKKK